MTQEEKARAYDEAIEIGKVLHKHGAYRLLMEDIFSELKESEDEKIRKRILLSLEKDLMATKNSGCDTQDLKKCITWLEKQGESNPYSGVSFEYNGHIWGMCARDNGVDILLDKKLFKHLEKQGEQVIDANKMIEQEWSEEDERIRKAISSLIQNGGHISKEFKEKVFSWLEKQRYSEFELENEYWRGYDDAKFHLKEDKVTVIGAGSNSASVSDGDNSVTSKEIISHPTVTTSTTIKPKFKVGDWITDGEIVFHITSYHNDYGYQVETTEGISFYLSDKRVENKYHLWTIQDAKDGDIIYIKRHKNNSEWLLTFKEIKIQNNLIDVYDYYAYSITTNNAYHQGFCGLWGLLLDDEIVCPATKEQCNLLFAKMKEEGYKWDAEKKDLKKISQEYPLTPDECTKSAWGKEDEEKFRDVIRLIEQGAPVQSMRDHYTNWLKSLKEKLKGE